MVIGRVVKTLPGSAPARGDLSYSLMGCISTAAASLALQQPGTGTAWHLCIDTAWHCHSLARPRLLSGVSLHGSRDKRTRYRDLYSKYSVGSNAQSRQALYHITPDPPPLSEQPHPFSTLFGHHTLSQQRSEHCWTNAWRSGLRLTSTTQEGWARRKSAHRELQRTCSKAGQL